jgi:hypothetical protein
MGDGQTAIDFDEDLAAHKHYEELRERMSAAVHDCAENHDISPAMVALLLVDIGVASYMLDYMLRTAKPSGSGLKLELDRFRREIEDFLRSSKKVADDYVSQCKQALNELDSEEASGTSNAA